ncbi:MAG: hypothetical protein LBQ66_09770 [Planctomycetaceae bacterium]|nr:hypothetical protein [Planctomycetaceae bacterium]
MPRSGKRTGTRASRPRSSPSPLRGEFYVVQQEQPPPSLTSCDCDYGLCDVKSFFVKIINRRTVN